MNILRLEDEADETWLTGPQEGAVSPSDASGLSFLNSPLRTARVGVGPVAHAVALSPLTLTPPVHSSRLPRPGRGLTGHPLTNIATPSTVPSTALPVHTPGQPSRSPVRRSDDSPRYCAATTSSLAKQHTHRALEDSQSAHTASNKSSGIPKPGWCSPGIGSGLPFAPLPPLASTSSPRIRSAVDVAPAKSTSVSPPVELRSPRGKPAAPSARGPQVPSKPSPAEAAPPFVKEAMAERATEDEDYNIPLPSGLALHGAFMQSPRKSGGALLHNRTLSLKSIAHQHAVADPLARSVKGMAPPDASASFTPRSRRKRAQQQKHDSTKWEHPWMPKAERAESSSPGPSRPPETEVAAQLQNVGSACVKDFLKGDLARAMHAWPKPADHAPPLPAEPASRQHTHYSAAPSNHLQGHPSLGSEQHAAPIAPSTSASLAAANDPEGTWLSIVLTDDMMAPRADVVATPDLWKSKRAGAPPLQASASHADTEEGVWEQIGRMRDAPARRQQGASKAVAASVDKRWLSAPRQAAKQGSTLPEPKVAGARSRAASGRAGSEGAAGPVSGRSKHDPLQQSRIPCSPALHGARSTGRGAASVSSATSTASIAPRPLTAVAAPPRRSQAERTHAPLPPPAAHGLAGVDRRLPGVTQGATAFGAAAEAPSAAADVDGVVDPDPSAQLDLLTDQLAAMRQQLGIDAVSPRAETGVTDALSTRSCSDSDTDTLGSPPSPPSPPLNAAGHAAWRGEASLPPWAPAGDVQAGNSLLSLPERHATDEEVALKVPSAAGGRSAPMSGSQGLNVLAPSMAPSGSAHRLLSREAMLRRHTRDSNSRLHSERYSVQSGRYSIQSDKQDKSAQGDECEENLVLEVEQQVKEWQRTSVANGVPEGGLRTEPAAVTGPPPSIPISEGPAMTTKAAGAIERNAPAQPEAEPSGPVPRAKARKLCFCGVL